MSLRVVRAPGALLLDPNLPATAQLVWMVAQLRPSNDSVDPGWITAASGLSRPTVLKALALLAACGWDPTKVPGPGTRVLIPGDLVKDRKLGFRARVLFGVLLLTPGFSHPLGHFTIAELAALARASPTTVTLALGELVRGEWIKIDRANRLARIHFELTLPGLDRAMTLLTQAQLRLNNPRHEGEALMREYLSVLVDRDDFEDDAAPGFLVNPLTEGRLELDRFYPPDVAFEFNGPQHYRSTEMFSETDVVQQQVRDYIKMGICGYRGITLVIVHPEDLSLNAMRQKVAGLLPLRDLTDYHLLIEYLESESQRYQRIAERFGTSSGR